MMATAVPNGLAVEEAPMTPESAAAIPRAAFAKARAFYLFAAAAVVVALALPARPFRGILGFIVFMFIAAPLAVAGWFIQRYSRADVRSGMIAKHTGKIEVDRSDTGRIGGTTYYLVLPDCKIRVSSELHGLLLATRGTVEYARRSQILLRITESTGRVLYENPYLARASAGSGNRAGAGDHSAPAREQVTHKIAGKPQGIALLGDEVWVADMQHGQLLTLDRETGDLRGDPVVVGKSPVGLAVAGGSVWAAVQEEGIVCRIDAVRRQVVARIAVGTDPILLTASEHDALWVGNLDDPSLWRIDIQDNSARRMIETVETDPEDPNGRYRFTAGPGFVAASDGSGIVRLFDAASAAPVGQVDAGEPVRSLAAAGGALWASQPEQSLLVRIDPTNLRITERLAVPAGCKEIFGSQDSVWLASALHKVVARVDAITGALAETVDLAIRPVLMAVDGNSVWITQTIPGRVVKLR